MPANPKTCKHGNTIRHNKTEIEDCTNCYREYLGLEPKFEACVLQEIGGGIYSPNVNPKLERGF